MACCDDRDPRAAARLLARTPAAHPSCRETGSALRPVGPPNRGPALDAGPSELLFAPSNPPGWLERDQALVVAFSGRRDGGVVRVGNAPADERPDDAAKARRRA